MSLSKGERDLVSNLPFVAHLPPDVVDLVFRLFQRRSFAFGDTIVAEGDDPDGMYLVTTGTARVLTTSDGMEVSLARVRSGESFGEMALLGGTTRNATVRASEHVEALVLDKVVFDALLADHPEVKEALLHQGEAQDLQRLLSIHGGFGGLPMRDADVVLSLARRVEVRGGAVLLSQGEAGRAMYIVEHGRLEAARDEDGTTQSVGFMRVGDLIGERSLVLGEPCAATVRALSDSVLLEVSGEDLDALSSASPSFVERVREIAQGRDYTKEARLPLDFGNEIIPKLADEGPEETGERQVETAAPSRRRPQLRLRARPRHKVPYVAQIDEADCGVACLSMVAAYHGINVSSSFLRDTAGTSVSGTTLRSIARTGRAIGLEVESLKVSRDRIEGLSLPAIIHWDKMHWVVLIEVSEGRAEVADPASGLRRLTRDELLDHWDGFAAVVTTKAARPALPSPRPNLRWLRPFLSKHRRLLAIALGCALLAAACEVALPLVVEVVVDDVVSPHAESTLDILGLVLLGLVLGGTFMALTQRLVLVGATARFDIDTLDFVTERLLGLPVSYFISRRTGDIERRLSGVREIRRLVVELGIEALTDVTQVLAGIAVMFALSPLLAGLFLVTSPVYALALKYSSKRLGPLYSGVEESFGRYASDQIDLLKGIETVKSTATESGLRHRLQDAFASFTHRTMSSYRTIAAFGSALQLISLVTYGLFIFVGSILVHDHHLGLGAFVAFTTLVLLTTGPLVGLLGIWDDVQVSSVLLNRIADVLEHQPEQGRAHERLLPVPSLEGRVQIRDLTYVPPSSESPVLAGVSLDVEPGVTVGVVGRSGSGKSTLLRLLAGLLEPTSGQILYDHVDLQTLDYSELRKHLGLVLQQPYVFGLSIAENIALGESVPDLDEVRAAAEIADLAELVSRLPLGYDTLVGDRGIPLSGGQAQRLAIARALYRRPSVLLFDEATSALDTESESTVKRNIDRILEHRTAFVVAHRLSTVRDADVIVVLEQGRLAEQGSHDELIEKRGIYYYLYTQQLSPG